MLVVRGNPGERANKNPPPEVADGGFVKSWLFVYAFNLPPPAIRAMATRRSHAARFGIEFSLAMKYFISFKIAPALYLTRASGQPIISVKLRKPFPLDNRLRRAQAAAREM